VRSRRETYLVNLAHFLIGLKCKFHHDF
jgi:hypothetical protein